MGAGGAGGSAEVKGGYDDDCEEKFEDGGAVGSGPGEGAGEREAGGGEAGGSGVGGAEGGKGDNLVQLAEGGSGRNVMVPLFFSFMIFFCLHMSFCYIQKPP